ncbi:MAG: 23S rRNA (guanosine(2251)-2'-O)-methyltransferase RlmB [Halanaerobiales bacterium]|nr:23S rRNA (guanosine(2251)-2'-O)-methyltransferase RlmB [Halanaerobiales bacterium]
MRNVEGKNPIIELLQKDKEIDQIMIQKGLKGNKVKKIISLAKKKGIEIKLLSKYVIDKKAETENHQGVIALSSDLKKVDLYKKIEELKEKKKFPLIVILDHIQDPHNFGAIIRTAYAAGVDAIIYPKDRASSLTATVEKVSAGAVEHISLIEVVNINRTIDILKEHYYWIIGAVLNGNKTYYEQDYNIPVALVVGHEGSGISRLTKEKCDFLVKIPMKNQFSSLNVSVASGIILFEIIKQRN